MMLLVVCYSPVLNPFTFIRWVPAFSGNDVTAAVVWSTCFRHPL